MRTVMMILGLIMIVLAGLWFFTPVLDGAYSRYTPGIAHSHNRSAAVRTPATRSATPAPGASAPSITSVQDLIGS